MCFFHENYIFPGWGCLLKRLVSSVRLSADDGDNNDHNDDDCDGNTNYDETDFPSLKTTAAVAIIVVGIGGGDVGG